MISNALAGNRTRASRVAGENSTTEPPVLRIQIAIYFLTHFVRVVQSRVKIKTTQG